MLAAVPKGRFLFAATDGFILHIRVKIQVEWSGCGTRGQVPPVQDLEGTRSLQSRCPKGR